MHSPYDLPPYKFSPPPPEDRALIGDILTGTLALLVGAGSLIGQVVRPVEMLAELGAFCLLPLLITKRIATRLTIAVTCGLLGVGAVIAVFWISLAMSGAELG